MLGSSFRSRIGRKFSTLFLFAAMLPLLIVSSVVYFYTEHYVFEEREHDLNQEAKLFNVMLTERARLLAQLVSDDEFVSLGAGSFSKYFNSVSYKPAVEVSQPNKYVPRLLTQADGRVFIVKPRVDEGLDHWYEVNLDYFFSGFLALSSEFSHCLITTEAKTLFCTDGLEGKEPMLESRLKNGDVARERWTLVDQQSWRIQTRPVFLGLDIHVEGWYIFTGIPLEDIYAPNAFFSYLFIVLFGLTLVLVILVSQREISRLLGPLKRLAANAEALSYQREVAEVVVDSKDEFEDLADAFNNMSRRVQRNFFILNSLSEVDRLIVERHELEDIVELAWERMRRVVRGELLMIAPIEDEQDARMLIISGELDQDTPVKASWNFEQSDPLVELLKTEESILLDRDEIERMDSGLAGLVLHSRFDTLKLRAITLNGKWMGFAAIGYSGVKPVSSDAGALLIGLADRIAVSLSDIFKGRALYHQANYDYLTSLPNRKRLRELLSDILIAAQDKNEQVALLFVDLDNFKQVNDSLGHTFGDQLLVCVSERLRQALNDADILAREGGDEFLLVLPGIRSQELLQRRLDDVLDLFKAPVAINGHHIYVSLSIGVSLFPDDAKNLDDLLMHADTALYKVKDRGKQHYLMYDSSMGVSAMERLELENALWDSIVERQLCFYYQPLMNMHNGKLGFEALIRWFHPEKGMISPDKFVHVAEETGFILEINDWMFDQIFAQVRVWLDQANFALDKVSINISPLQLLLPDFIEHLSKSLVKHRVPVEHVELELTEGVFLDNQEQAELRMNALKELGFALALDDFGTGYSSLSYLQRLPFDRLKIDKSFISHVQEGETLPELVLAIIKMAQSLGLSVTAEGVELKSQMISLQEAGCQVIQGYFLSRPLPAEECTEFATLSARFFKETGIAPVVLTGEV